MIRVLTLVVFFLIQSLFSHPCVFKEGIDLTLLSSSDGYSVRGFGNFDFLLNICGPVNNARLIPCDGDAYIPSLIYNQTICHALSRSPSHKDDVKVSWIDELNHEKGVELVYKNGRSFDHDGEIISTVTRIEIGCNKLREISPTFQKRQKINQQMVYFFRMESQYACANHIPVNEFCTIRTSEGIINMRRQAFPSSQEILGIGMWDLQVNICAPAIKCRNLNVPATLNFFNDPKNCNHTSNVLNSMNVKTELINSNNPNMGVIITYLNGDTFYQDGLLLKSETQIIAECDPFAPIDTKLIIKGYNRVGDKMVYTLTIKSKHACPIK